MAQTIQRFPSPFDVRAPEGCEGWEQFYPYYSLFSEERRAFEESKFWFLDSMHHPEPIYPFDAITAESWGVALSAYTTRVFAIPPALGIDQRIVNGRLYISPNTVTDPDVVKARSTYFERRAGYYYAHWDELYQQWISKVEQHIRVLKEIEVRDLPDMEDEAVVTEGRGVGAGYHLLEAYNRVIENMHKVWYYHFEMLNLGYVAYLTFMDFCRRAFPGITDQTVASMVAGIDVLLFRPDDELKRLAKLAIDLDVAAAISELGTPTEVVSRLEETAAGSTWVAELNRAKEPWFYFSSGPGFYHSHRSWIDDPSVPFAAIADYITQLEKGETIDRPLEQIRRERERVAAEYAEFLRNSDDKKAFHDLLTLARLVFPYVENHNFYVEHWHHTIFWNKIREFGRIFVSHGFFGEPDDVFYLHRYDVYDALYDLITAWAVGTPARGSTYWPREISRRKTVFGRLREWSPVPALGPPPEVVTEPFTVMLWGITAETIRNWMGREAASTPAREVKGTAASPGVGEGPARVIRGPDQLGEIQPGEILVCPSTSPSWSPVFTRIAATVSDIGGIMCHAAIVSREYGLPAVVGTGFGTKVIQTGQRIRVDGNTGVVTIVSQ